MTIDLARLRVQLIQHEGLRLKPYKDTVGKLTIGVGRNLTDKGISRDEAMILLDHDIDETVQGLSVPLDWFQRLDPIRKRVLVDMGFNVGVPGLLLFKNTLRLVQEEKYTMAATAMLKSEWAKQVGQRAVRLSQMMETGMEVI